VNEMDKWEKLKKRLKDIAEKYDEMSYYEYIQSKDFGSKEVLELMDKIEAEENAKRPKLRMFEGYEYPDDYGY